MVELELDTTMQASPARLFDALDDPSLRPHWQRSLKAIESRDVAGPGVGARWRERTHLGPAFDMEVTEHARPTRWAERGTGGGVTAHLVAELSPEAEGTRLRLRVSLHLPWPLRPVGPVLRRLIQRELAADLRRLDALACAQPEAS